MQTNPLTEVASPVPFDLIEAEHVVPAVETLLAHAEAAVEKIEAHQGPRTFANTLAALDEATESLEYAGSIAGHLESVVSTEGLRAAYNEVQPKISAFYSALPLRPKLWDALRSLARQEAASPSMSPLEARCLEKTIDDFRRHGADLSDSDKKRLLEIDVALSESTTKFAQNVLDSTAEKEWLVTDEARLAGLPEHAKAQARKSAEDNGQTGFRFTLHGPSLQSVLTFLDDETLRREMWQAYHKRATEGEHDNRPLVRKILELRQQKAELLGFDNFAEFVLSDRMAKSGQAARRFVDELKARSVKAFQREHEVLTRFAKDIAGKKTELAPWDLGYFSEKLRKHSLDFDEEALRPYFRAENVLRGAFTIAERLYGIRIEPAALPGWDSDVKAFRVYLPEVEETRAFFYVDLFPRSNKRDGAWMNALVTGVPTGSEGEKGEFSRPHVGLFCANLTPPSTQGLSLLSLREVETIFHEFGHLLHHVLTEVPVRSLAGTRVAWDFVELPSQIMENWCWEKEALDVFARHSDTGDTIPADLLEKMKCARTFRAGTAMMRQLGFAAADLALHIDWHRSPSVDPITFARDVLKDFAPAGLPEDYSMVASFGHLFAGPIAYAAGYYSYKWAEVLDADAFSLFKKQGLLNREVGEAFRKHILSRGDSDEPEKLFADFMGRSPDKQALLERSGLLLP